MAAGAEISVEAAKNNEPELRKSESESESESEFNNEVQKLVEIFTKLNPLAKEFVPSSYPIKQNGFNPNKGFDQDEILNNNLINRRVFYS